MSKRESYELKTEELLKPIAHAANVEIYDVEYIKEGSDWYLRCYIDKEGGVTIDDCEKVSRGPFRRTGQGGLYRGRLYFGGKLPWPWEDAEKG